MPEWFEDERFWDELYPLMFSARKFEVAEDEVSSILHLADLEEGDVLDLACGPGRHATALGKRGFRVTGVDLSPFLLEKAMGLAQVESVNVEWVREDMRCFVRPEAFDLVINMFTAFGYFDDKRDDIAGSGEHPSESPRRRCPCHGCHGQGVPCQRLYGDDLRGVGREQAPGAAA